MNNNTENTNKIEEAIEELNYSFLEDWLKKGGNIDILLSNKLTPLQDLLLTGGDDEEEIVSINKIADMFLEYNASINLSNSEDSLQPLFSAVREGYSLLVRKLIERGAKLNLKDEEGYTPLITAIEIDNPKIVQAIAEHASKETLSISGGHWAYQPLGLAMNNVNIDIIDILISNGCDPLGYDNDNGQNIERLPTDISEHNKKTISNILLINGFDIKL